MCKEIDKEELERIKERRYLLYLSPLDLGREIAVLQEMVEKCGQERKGWAEAELEKRLEIEKGLFEDEIMHGTHEKRENEQHMMERMPFVDTRKIR